MHHIFVDLFTIPVPILEKILRPILVYAFLVLLLRIFGKRELAQLNPFDLVVVISLANTVQNAIIGDDNSVTGGLVGAATLLFANYVVVRFLWGHERLDRLIEGEADVLVSDGQVRMDRLEKELITLAELEAAARKQGIASLAEVERAVLEPGGAISFVAKRPTPEAARHEAVMARLDELARQLAALRSPATP